MSWGSTPPDTLIQYTMFVTTPELKVKRLCSDIDQLAAKGHVTNLQFVCVLGQAAHLITSHGSILQIVTRQLHHLMTLSVMDNSWYGHMSLDYQYVARAKPL